MNGIASGRITASSPHAGPQPETSKPSLSIHKDRDGDADGRDDHRQETGVPGHYLFVFYGGPFENKLTAEGLSWVSAVLKRAPGSVRVFLIGDAVYCARGNENPIREGAAERRTFRLILDGATVAVCNRCLEARGIHAEQLLRHVVPGSMALLAEWTEQADKVIVL